MSACKTADRKSKRFCARGSGYICRGEAERASDTARTACDYLGLVSAVHIYHSRSAHAAVVKACSALKSDLLGNSKEALDRRMRGEIALRAVKYIKHCRNCHAVVSAKGSSVCSEPAVLLYELDALVQKVVLNVRVLLAHHIGMSLKKHRVLALSALACGELDKDVVYLVSVIFKPSLLCKGAKVVCYSLLVE